MAPVLGGLGHQGAGRHLCSQSLRSGHRLCAGAAPAPRPPGQHEHRRHVRIRHARPGDEVAGERRPPRGVLRDNVPQPSTPQASRPRTLRASDVILSGKAGLLFKATAAGNVYVSYGSTVTPPGTANFTLERAGQQPEQPEREAPGIDQLRGRQQVGLCQRPALAEHGDLPHREPERDFHRRRHGDPADLQPGRQPARQRRLGRIDRPHHDSRGRCSRISPISTACWTRRTTPIAASACTLTPKYSGSLWTTLSAADEGHRRAAVSAQPTRSSSTRPTRSGCRAITLVDGLVEYEVNKNLTLRLNLSNLTDETLHPQHQQQRRPLHPRPAARGARSTSERHVLRSRAPNMLLTIPDVLTARAGGARRASSSPGRTG